MSPSFSLLYLVWTFWTTTFVRFVNQMLEGGLHDASQYQLKRKNCDQERFLLDWDAIEFWLFALLTLWAQDANMQMLLLRLRLWKWSEMLYNVHGHVVYALFGKVSIKLAAHNTFTHRHTHTYTLTLCLSNLAFTANQDIIRFIQWQTKHCCDEFELFFTDFFVYDLFHRW